MEENQNVNPEVNEEDGGEKKAGRFITDDELSLLLQKEGDKRVSQFQKTLEKRQRESNRLKNMTDSEKYEYELSEREKELEERETKLILAENKTTCSSILLDKGLDVSLVDFVVDTSADEMDRKIKLLEKAFKKSVKAEVEKRLAGNTPKMNLPPDGTMTKADLMKMSVRELQLFKNQQPQMYAELMGQK